MELVIYRIFPCIRPPFLSKNFLWKVGGVLYTEVTIIFPKILFNFMHVRSYIHTGKYKKIYCFCFNVWNDEKRKKKKRFYSSYRKCPRQANAVYILQNYPTSAMIRRWRTEEEELSKLPRMKRAARGKKCNMVKSWGKSLNVEFQMQLLFTSGSTFFY